jgi:diguanylate cyclase (GGDEF)-like protein
MCDIDHFKQVNDTYGHQAGDEALVSFAALLKRCCRPGDLVARYGGEEFVLLCADCDNATATERAEQIRRQLADTPQNMLASQSITASFGVTEIQPGDTPETMLRRADRALLQAKDNGRNRVVQLGSGIFDVEPPGGRRRWFAWLQQRSPDELIKRRLVSAAPMTVALEKLRGFAADHHAEVVAIEDHRVALKIDASTQSLRRRTDRPVSFVLELNLEETRIERGGVTNAQVLRTVINVSIRPRRRRDRRRNNAIDQARRLLVSVKSYLMAHVQSEVEGLSDERAGDEQEPHTAAPSAENSSNTAPELENRD